MSKYQEIQDKELENVTSGTKEKMEPAEKKQIPR